MNLFLTLLYALLIVICCKTISPNKQEEYLQVQKISYRTVNNELVVQASFSDNIWFQDSIGITQLSGLKGSPSGSYDTLYATAHGYRFVDMRRNWVYEYRNLSDTAEIVHKFAKADSIGLAGGWGFFRPAAIRFDSLQIVGDTNINGIVYKKFRFVQNFQGTKFIGEALARCDRKGTIFHLDVGLSNAVGCPVVKGTSFLQGSKFPSSSVEIKFISNEFPDSVRRVFAAWKRNEKLHPVQ